MKERVRKRKSQSSKPKIDSIENIEQPKVVTAIRGVFL